MNLTLGDVIDLSLLYPMLAMVALTAVVWVRLYVERIGEMSARGIDPQQVAKASEATTVLQRTQAADNFRNLFEVPVLFYLLCLTATFTLQIGAALQLGAWLYVVLRALHSFIHCTYNTVMHRFVVYLLSTALLFGLWILFAITLLRA